MKKLNRKGYTTILTIITIGLLGIMILGLLNLYSLNLKKVLSNESSIKAYYLGESGITVLKTDIDETFERYFDEYNNYLTTQGFVDYLKPDDTIIQKNNMQKFKDYVLIQDGFKDLQQLRIEEDMLVLYEEPHSWRLEIEFKEEDIILNATGQYKEARKRMVAIISYPDVQLFNGVDDTVDYRFIPSEILVYYQGYEGEYID